MTHQVVLTETDRAAVSAAVSAAEGHSAGEIVTIMAERSDSYHDVALLWSALAALITLAALAIAPQVTLGLVDRVTGAWQADWHPSEVFSLALFAASVNFVAMWLLQLWQPLRLWLVPGPLKHARVRARAVTNFKIGTERRTHGRTGVLIYLSLAEHRAEIVADDAIAAKVSPEVWGAAMATLIGEIRAGRPAEGLVGAVTQVGAVLAEHFPRADDDVNELPDRLIEV